MKIEKLYFVAIKYSNNKEIFEYDEISQNLTKNDIDNYIIINDIRKAQDFGNSKFLI